MNDVARSAARRTTRQRRGGLMRMGVRSTCAAMTAVAVGLLVAGGASGAAAPRITSFSPTSGPVGTSITINGTCFASATGAFVGDTDLGGFTVLSATKVRGYVQSESSSGKLVVTGDDGDSAPTNALFKVTPW